jgi:hypothetical protein
MRRQMAEVIMPCLSCASENQLEFASQMMIHFPGLKNLNMPGVAVFSGLLVCLNCGFSHFTVQEPELACVVNGAPHPETTTLDREIEYPTP